MDSFLAASAVPAGGPETIRLTPAEWEALHAPSTQALGLPGRFYGEDALAAESRRLFPRHWTAIGVAASVPQPGDAMPVMLGHWPLFMLRDRDGQVRVFLNICAHRGHRLVTEAGRLRNVIRCPWHSWSYDFTGKLVATPHSAGYNVEGGLDVPRETAGLREVRAGVWYDLVFVDLSGTLPPLAEHLAELTPQFAMRGYDRMVPLATFTHSYPGNWKESIEGGIEDYHLPWGHPQLTVNVKRRGQDYLLIDKVFMGYFSDMQVGDEGRPWSNRGHRGFVEADGLRFLLGNIFPTGVILADRDYLFTSAWLPDGAHRTHINIGMYVPPSALEPGQEEANARLVADFKEILAQDSDFVGNVHATHQGRELAGMRNRFVAAWELAVLAFQRQVAATMAAE